MKKDSKGEEEAMFCTKCGSEIAEGSAFCRNCGAPVGAQASAANATAGAPQPMVGAGSPAPKRDGARKGAIVAAAAAVVLVLTAGFVTSWFGLAGAQSEEAVEAPAASQDLSDTGSSAQDDAGAAELQNEGAQGEGAASEQDGDAQVAASTDAAAAAVSAKPTVEAYTWDELSQISTEIGAAADEAAAIEVAKRYNLCTPEGKLDGTQLKTVTLGDGTQATAQIIGFAHDDKADGGKAGITFALRNCLYVVSMNFDITNAGGWEASGIRGSLGADKAIWFPEDLLKVVVPVKKMTNNAGKTESVEDVTETIDEFWLPSSVEVWGEYGGDPATMSPEDRIERDIQSAQGTQYKLFSDLADAYKQDASVSPNSSTIRFAEGGQATWWLRDPKSDTDSSFSCVSDDGLYVYEDGAASTKGFAPCFCI